MLLAALALAAALVLAACSPRPLRMVTIGGQTWTVYEGSADGMRSLPGFGDADGMLFDRGRDVDPGAAAFVMEGVGYPIDIAWFGADGTLVSMTSMAPCDAPPCPLYHAAGPYRWAVEAPVGAFADLRRDDRLVVGD